MGDAVSSGASLALPYAPMLLSKPSLAKCPPYTSWEVVLVSIQILQGVRVAKRKLTVQFFPPSQLHIDDMPLLRGVEPQGA